MLKRFLFTIIVLAFAVNTAYANAGVADEFGYYEGFKRCDAMENLDRQIKEDPTLEARMADIEAQTQEYLSNPPATAMANGAIDVVVHVIYKTSAQNISDAQVQSQIQVLNSDFNNVTFNLVDITRTYTRTREWRANDSMKQSSKGGVDAWDTSRYLNIWVCNLGSGLLGYAQFPGGAAWSDGVVCLYSAFGTSRAGATAAPYNEGRTTTHEVGHWLNLRHIWGDGGCGVDDFVSDTAESDGPNYGCPIGHVSCGSVDDVDNYMDYTDDACMNHFSNGQYARMDACLNGPRADLLGGGTTPPPSGGDMINTIDALTVSGKKNQKANADISVTSDGSPVSGAVVSVSWSGTVSGTVSGTTDSNGDVTISSPGTRTSNPSFIVTVTNVSKDGFTWDSVNSQLTATTGGSARFGAENFALTSFPNPTKSTSTISYKLPVSALTTVQIYNNVGQLVNTLVSANQEAGDYTIRWDGTNKNGAKVVSGTYFYQIISGNQKEAKRLQIVR
jgi:hypothetical protein